MIDSPMVPFVDLVARHSRVAQQAEKALLAVLRSGQWVGGPVVQNAEAAIARIGGKNHAVGVGNGTDALTLALMAIGVRAGDEVLVPAVTFFATAGAVLRLGAKPIVVDVLPDLPLIDPEAAKQKLTAKTTAVIPVHLFGLTAPKISLGIPVVDDAAQAMGANPPVGHGVIAATSFYPTKVLGVAGDGGAVLTNDANLASRVRKLANHGMVAPHVHEAHEGHVGWNSRLDGIQAALLLAHLDDLPSRLERRRQIAQQYDEAFADQAVPHNAGSPVSVYVLLHPERDRVAQDLQNKGIQTAIYYPHSLSQQPAIASEPTPNADRFCAQALALPCHATLNAQQVDTVIAAVRSSI